MAKDRSAINRANAQRRWAGTTIEQRREATRPAADAAWRKHLDAVDPEGTLDPAVRERLAKERHREQCRAAAALSVQARKRRDEYIRRMLAAVPPATAEQIARTVEALSPVDGAR